MRRDIRRDGNCVISDLRSSSDYDANADGRDSQILAGFLLAAVFQSRFAWPAGL
jgi:hypothetical protein